jgi:transposase-like protein
MKCLYCKGLCVKRGKKNGVQRYACKACGKTQQKHYKKHRIPQYKYDWIVKLNNECCGISNISRLLRITKSSVQRLICKIAHQIKMPIYEESNQSYEVDELRTYCGNKENECWIMKIKYCTNKIERHNLTLRTHLKRLVRKTLCFTKSDEMLENCVRLYCFR